MVIWGPIVEAQMELCFGTDPVFKVERDWDWEWEIGVHTLLHGIQDRIKNKLSRRKL